MATIRVCISYLTFCQVMLLSRYSVMCYLLYVFQFDCDERIMGSNLQNFLLYTFDTLQIHCRFVTLFSITIVLVTITLLLLR